MIKSVRDLNVYQVAYKLAMEIFEITKKFPKEETRGWLDFARDCRYMTKNEHKKLDDRYDEVNAMLYSLTNNWQSFSDL